MRPARTGSRRGRTVAASLSASTTAPDAVQLIADRGNPRTGRGPLPPSLGVLSRPAKRSWSTTSALRASSRAPGTGVGARASLTFRRFQGSATGRYRVAHLELVGEHRRVDELARDWWSLRRDRVLGSSRQESKAARTRRVSQLAAGLMVLRRSRPRLLATGEKCPCGTACRSILPRAVNRVDIMCAIMRGST
jgi:hypothetical protein